MTEAIPDTLSALTVPVADLRHYGKNPRQGNVDAIAESLQIHGQYRPVVVNRRTNEVLAGNHTLKAARQLGWPSIAATFVDVDDDQAARIVLVDNRSNDVAAYDDVALVDLLQSLPDLAGTGFTDRDLDDLLAGVVEEVPPALTDPDDAPEPPEEPVSEPGDLWHLGPHRLLCGDSTSPDDVQHVLADLGEPGIVYTDPPYGISIVRQDGRLGKGRGYRPVIGDESSQTATDSFGLVYSTYPDALHVWWGANHYAASARMPDASCWLVWDKENGERTFADAELAWTNHPGAVRLFRHMWHGVRASERGKRVHPNQKPVALGEWAFGRIDPNGERSVILDVFGGSGSTLLAAHKTKRVAALIEMEPVYVDVICRRYQQHTGTKPILEATGESHDFTAS